MSRFDVALVTSRELPELDLDDRPLAADLRAAGLAVAIVSWDDPTFAWTDTTVAMLRNPWDYFRRLDEFVAWAERTAAETVLLNPWPLVKWNLHKRYLVELAERGAPVVPTAFLERGAAIELATFAAERGWNDIVLKPAVSADSWETHRLCAGEFASTGQAHLTRLIAERDLVLQPFLSAVEVHGERCLVFIDGELSHAVRKNALTQGGRWTGLPEGSPVAPAADEIAAARRVFEAARLDRPLYARVDLVRAADGEPLLLELELIEPTLFLAAAPAGRALLVSALRRRIDTALSAG